MQLQTQNALADLAKALGCMEAAFKGIDPDLKTKEKNAVVFERLQKLWPGLVFSECPTAKEIAQCEKAAKERPASASGKQSSSAAGKGEGSSSSSSSSTTTSSSSKKKAAAAEESPDAAPSAKRKKKSDGEDHGDEAEF